MISGQDNSAIMSQKLGEGAKYIFENGRGIFFIQILKYNSTKILSSMEIPQMFAKKNLSKKLNLCKLRFCLSLNAVRPQTT